MFIGEKDDECPPGRALELADRLQTLANEIFLKEVDHDFLLSGDDFLNLLAAELTDEVPSESTYQEITLSAMTTTAGALFTAALLIATI